MKIRMLSYCQEKINNEVVIFDNNKVVNLNDEKAMDFINRGLAEEVGETAGSFMGSAVEAENKMLNIIYKKRGRPRKEG